MLHRSIVSPAGKHTASLIFLHGSGDTGIGIRSWVKEVFERIGDRQGFNFKHIKVIYPTAAPQPYTPLNGRLSNVWYDREKISFESPDNMKSVESMAKHLLEIVEDEKKCGIPSNRILIGGFSMGGSMSLHLGYRHYPEIKGMFVLSSFLSLNSEVFENLKKIKEQGSKIPELFTCHGTKDPLVKYKWGKKTFEELVSLGVKGKFHTFDIYHEISSEEMVLLREWVLEMIPEIPETKL